MNDFAAKPISAESSREPAATLYMWRDSGIVLLGTREEDRFVLARGWLRGDGLADVRRWSFSEQRRFSGQVRRLVREAGHDAAVASTEAARALDWTSASS